MGEKSKDQKQIRKLKGVIWFGLIFFSLPLFIIIADGSFSTEWHLFLLSLLMIAISLFALWKLREISYQPKEYKPRKGFWFLRMSKEKKFKHYTLTQWFMVVALLVLYITETGNLATYGFGITYFFMIQFHFKKRLLYHVQLDDATLFELEMLGIISSGEVVRAIYKDFASWEEVKEGSKIVVLTEDHLVSVTMQDKEHGSRMQCPLRQINGLTIVNHGKYGKGTIMAIGTINGGLMQIALDGKSHIDSPEEFIRYFLETLDQVLVPTNTYSSSPRFVRNLDTESASSQQHGYRPSSETTRKIDL
jgi:hypothetical protein